MSGYPMTPPWYFITGGPSCGKDTILNELKKKGFYVMDEAARLIIDEYNARGISTEELRKNEEKFQNMIFARKIEMEEQLPKDRIVFLNRGLHETIAYSMLYQMDYAQVDTAITGRRYRKGFFLEQLPFVKDYARTETPEQIAFLNTWIPLSYTRKGEELIRVPKFSEIKEESIEKRVQMILAHVELSF